MASVLTKWAPVQQFSTEKTLSELRSEYASWHVGAVGLFLTLTLAFTWAYVALFSYLAGIRFSALPATNVELHACVVMWLGPSFFMAIITSAVPGTLTYRFLLGERYREYMYYIDLTEKYNTRRALPYAVWIAVSISTALILVGLQHYALFSEQGIVLNRVPQFVADSYTYNEIKTLAHLQKYEAPNGNVSEDPHFRIAFQDGTMWSTRDSIFCVAEENYASLFRYLEEKTGLSVREYELWP